MNEDVEGKDEKKPCLYVSCRSGMHGSSNLDSDELMSRIFFIYLGASERFLHVANES